LKLKRRGEERKKQHMWPGYKRHSKRGGQHVLHRKRYRSTVTSGVYLQKVHVMRAPRRKQSPMHLNT